MTDCQTSTALAFRRRRNGHRPLPAVCVRHDPRPANPRAGCLSPAASVPVPSRLFPESRPRKKIPTMHTRRTSYVEFREGGGWKTGRKGQGVRATVLLNPNHSCCAFKAVGLLQMSHFAKSLHSISPAPLSPAALAQAPLPGQKCRWAGGSYVAWPPAAWSLALAAALGSYGGRFAQRGVGYQTQLIQRPAGPRCGNRWTSSGTTKTTSPCAADARGPPRSRPPRPPARTP